MKFRELINWPLIAALVLALVVVDAETDDAKPAPKSGAPLPIADLQRDMPVDFEKEVLPFLKNNCLACHNTTKAKGGLNLETPQWILKGGDGGPAAVAGKSAESLLFKAAAHLDPELIMPPKDNKANASNLAAGQLALLKLWIDQGAKGEVRAAAPINWLEKPPVLDPILAVALTQDGQFAACGRGSRIDVYHVPSGRLVAQLSDEKLTAAGLTNAAHRDVVNALAFNPDGTVLASAGYREVKLWHRPRNAQRTLPVLTTLTNRARHFAVSPDRKWLAAATDEHTVALFDLVSGLLTRTLFGHSNTVTSVKFSPGSQQLLSGSADHTARVWSIPEGLLTGVAETSGEIHAVTWLTDGKQFASGGADGGVRIWESSGSRREEAPVSGVKDAILVAPAATLALVKELKGHTNSVTALETLPEGKQIISGGIDGTVRQWNLDDGKSVRELKQEGPVVALAVRPDGKRFASAATNGLVQLWDAADGKAVAELKGDRYAYERVGEMDRALIVGKSDVEFRKKSLETAEAEHKKQTERVAKAAETNAATEKIFTEKDKAFKDAQTAKAGSEKALIELLTEIQRVATGYTNADNAAKSAAINAKALTAKSEQAQISAERATLSKGDAERLATEAAGVATRAKAALGNADAAKDTATRIAEESAAVAEKSKGFADAVVADAEMKSKLAAESRVAAEKAIEEVAALAFAAGQLKPAYDKTLAEAPENRKQSTNQIETATKTLTGAEQELKRAETRKSVTGHELELGQQAQKRAADVLASAKTALATAESAHKETEATLERAKKAAKESEQPVRALVFSPDGLTFAALVNDGGARTWSAETGAAFEVFPGGGSNVPPALLCFLDAKTLVVAANAQRMIAWDLNPAWTLERAMGTGDIDSPISDRVNAVRFSPDGKTLATGGGEPTRSGEIKLWNAADGKFLREFSNVHSDAVLSLDFSPDGKSIASSSADRFVRVVDLTSGKVVKAFEGHTSYVLGVAWKRDSRTLASAGADNVIKVWDFVTGERKKNIDGASKEVTSISFVGVTDQALATSGDNQVRLLRETGEKVRSFEGAGDFVNCGSATPDGQWVVAGGQDGVLRVWDGRDGKLRASFGLAQGK